MTLESIADFYLYQFIARFYHTLDIGDSRKAASFFANEGYWRRKGEQLTGPAAIAAALEKRDKERVTCHSVSNFLATPESDDDWRTSYYLTVYDNQSETGLRTVAIMQCEDQIRIVDGVAKISAKVSKKLLPSPLENASSP